ncbi:MAG: hypothetical protein AAF514_03910 [Verrucomicrobiota bacterium]
MRGGRVAVSRRRHCVAEREAVRLKDEGSGPVRWRVPPPRSSSLAERLEAGLVWLRQGSRSEAVFLLATDGLTVLAGQPPVNGWDRHTSRLANDLAGSGSMRTGLFQVEETGRVFTIVLMGPGAQQGFLVFVRKMPLRPKMGIVYREEVACWFHPPA